jgi:hypothetical protein
MAVEGFTLANQQLIGIIKITALSKVLFPPAECEIATWPQRITIYINVIVWQG